MKKAQKEENEQDPEAILQSNFHGIPVENLLAMINSALYIQEKSKTKDWKAIYEQISGWSEVPIKDKFTYKELHKFYKSTLQRIPDNDRYFVVDKIQTVAARDQELMVLVDWKYFPPSDPRRESNWTTINLIAYDEIYEYLLSETNKEIFTREIAKLPSVYGQKLSEYLDTESFEETIAQTQTEAASKAAADALATSKQAKEQTELLKLVEELREQNSRLEAQANAATQAVIKLCKIVRSAGSEIEEAMTVQAQTLLEFSNCLGP